MKPRGALFEESWPGARKLKANGDMRHLPLAALIALAACSDAGQARVERATAALCRLDGIAQPVTVALVNGVTTTVPGHTSMAVATVAAVDVALIHPSVVAACQSRGGTVVKAVEAGR